jgi:mannan endo-1,4-beta-mannosidase
MKPKVLAACAAVAVAVCAAVWNVTEGGTGKPTPFPSTTARPIYACASPTQDNHYVGLSVPGFPPDASKLTALEERIKLRPSAVSMYIPLGMKLDMSAVTEICAQGALPVIEIDSDDIPLNRVADGDYDNVLISYAEDLKALGYPVGIDFDHEFNSPVWDWGTKKQSAKNFIAAWRHIVQLFRKVGADHVTWSWNPATDGKGTAPIRPWYPGSAYVTWVGLDGYFTSPQSTFRTVFGPTLAYLKTFANLPVFIDETGANPAAQ